MTAPLVRYGELTGDLSDVSPGSSLSILPVMSVLLFLCCYVWDFAERRPCHRPYLATFLVVTPSTSFLVFLVQIPGYRSLRRCKCAKSQTLITLSSGEGGSLHHLPFTELIFKCFSKWVSPTILWKCFLTVTAICVMKDVLLTAGVRASVDRVNLTKFSNLYNKMIPGDLVRSCQSKLLQTTGVVIFSFCSS